MAQIGATNTPAPTKPLATAPTVSSSGMTPMAMDLHGGDTMTMSNQTTYTPNIAFTLKTNIAEGRLVYTGVGGDIEGVVNPQLKVKTGDVVQVTLVNGDGAEHDASFPDFNTTSDHVTGMGASSSQTCRPPWSRPAARRWSSSSFKCQGGMSWWIMPSRDWNEAWLAF